ncbi:MAG: hypothetical protein KGM24_07940 [Elusimicrobia bacterium]|nr:hypothetical protein [Elusimicrobiota bacterium]
MSRKDLLVLAVWCAAVLALLSPVWARPGAVFFNHGDLYAYHVPLRALTASGLQAGRLPFWDPYILLGVPHAANPQAALFYPPALLGDLFPVALALVWSQVFHLLWAGAGVFLLARRGRVDRAGAFVLASAYALSPFLVYRVTAGIPTLLAALAWAPWLWLAWLSAFPGLLAAALALQLFSGHGQFLLINLAAMALWGLLHDGRLALLRRLAVEGAAALALTAVQWVPTAQYLRESVRADWSGAMSGAYSLPPGALWTWINPGALGAPASGTWRDVLSVFYETCGGHVGLVALALAAWGLARGPRRLAPALLAALGFLLARGPRGPLSRAFLGFAVLSYLRTPSRWLFLTVWAAILLAGAGWLALRARRRPAGVLLVLAFAGLLPLAAWDAPYLRPQDPAPFLAPNRTVADTLGGRPQRVLTDPQLANPNKTILYRLLNVDGYEAFYPKRIPAWADAVQGAVAADASRVYVSRWPSRDLARAGVAARLSPKGLETQKAWPLAAFVDARGRRARPDPRVYLQSPERWRVAGLVPESAAGLELALPAYPGWRAFADGVRVALEPVDGVFQILPLPASYPRGAELSLTLDFVPTAWAWLVLLSAAAWGAWLALLARRGA